MIFYWLTGADHGLVGDQDEEANVQDQLWEGCACPTLEAAKRAAQEDVFKMDSMEQLVWAYEKKPSPHWKATAFEGDYEWLIREIELPWIKMSALRPQPGQLIVKRWANGSVWAGVYNGTDKDSSFDEWKPL